MKMAESHRVTAQGRKRWSLPLRHETDQNKWGSRCPDGEAERKLVTVEGLKSQMWLKSCSLQTPALRAVPFRGHISDGLQPGKKVIVVGAVDPRPDRFYIALTCGHGTSREPPPNVALELCVRFRDRQVLRRACMSGSWGEVERVVPFFPFIKDQPFKIEIHCEHGRFRVFVDSHQLFNFHHRVFPLGDIDTLWIKGSITITKLA